MQILIMRHGEAQTFAHTDPLRPLTERGRLASIKMGQYLVEKGIEKVDLAMVSPYLRAEQTWRAVNTYLSAQSVETEEMITPYGDPETVSALIKATVAIRNLECMILVSHLPLVGYLTSELVPEMSPPMFPTSTVACIEYNTHTDQSVLAWIESISA
ncbi:phosphohistidine phosphatase SixA [Thaumasiovibrio subtropicus]|uniref:phosphohistidine phosphatase SixA n=1 Tax=Thaumasiovibrio subtropicus TaxID=1891207 RepID=UPI000B36298A|nr:phosphohistidine phosphatase SixA [Thaumasiovibrio subtropicus]